MAEIYEARPPKTLLQLISEACSVQSANLRAEGSGGTPEMRPEHFAACLSCIYHGDMTLVTLAKAAIWAKITHRESKHDVLAEGRDEKQLACRELAIWGWHRWFWCRRKGNIDYDTNKGVAAAACHGYISDKWLSASAIRKSNNWDMGKWNRLEPHYRDMVDRLHEGEKLVVNHLRKQLGYETYQNDRKSAISEIA